MSQAKLFEPYARKAADAESDIDLLLFADNNFKPPRYLGVAEDLHRASDKHVDVYEISELDESPFRENALKETVALRDQMMVFGRQAGQLAADEEPWE